MEEASGLVLLGEVLAADPDASATPSWLASMAAELNAAFGGDLLVEFSVVEGDALEASLRPEVDPFAPMLRASLASPTRKMRWVVLPAGTDTPEGLRALARARANRERVVVALARPERDALLNDMAPALVDMLDGLTPTQREVARMAIVEGLRQSEVAGRVGKRRATVSVSFARAKVVPIERLVAAMRRIHAAPDDPPRPPMPG